MSLIGALRPFNPLSLLRVPIFDQLAEMLLRAVPKKKVTHARKRIRSLTKGLKNLTNIIRCPICSGPKLTHTLCWNCMRGFHKDAMLDLHKAQH